MHGVFMDILGLGVMITGESGLGKSELGLELISRGNGLVADDAVDLFRINQTTIEGTLPRVAAEPAGSARHRPAGHPRHLW
jgi:HPr kinase/phosphorylase